MHMCISINILALVNKLESPGRRFWYSHSNGFRNGKAWCRGSWPVTQRHPQPIMVWMFFSWLLRKVEPRLCLLFFLTKAGRWVMAFLIKNFKQNNCSLINLSKTNWDNKNAIDYNDRLVLGCKSWIRNFRRWKTTCPGSLLYLSPGALSVLTVPISSHEVRKLYQSGLHPFLGQTQLPPLLLFTYWSIILFQRLPPHHLHCLRLHRSQRGMQ